MAGDRPTKIAQSEWMRVHGVGQFVRVLGGHLPTLTRHRKLRRWHCERGSNSDTSLGLCPTSVNLCTMWINSKSIRECV